MLDFLIQSGNLPFLVALAIMLLIGVVEAAGLGASAAHIDADLDGAGDWLTWLGIGQLPVLVLIVVFLALFGIIGIAGQGIARSLVGEALPLWVAVPGAAALALPLLGVSARALSRVFPRDETTAVGRDSLIGKRATVTVGTARQGAPARATVRDEHGHVHHVMVEPFSEASEARTGTSLLLVRREGELFIGLAEGETLDLSLEDRPRLFG